MFGCGALGAPVRRAPARAGPADVVVAGARTKGRTESKRKRKRNKQSDESKSIRVVSFRRGCRRGRVLHAGHNGTVGVAWGTATRGSSGSTRRLCGRRAGKQSPRCTPRRMSRGSAARFGKDGARARARRGAASTPPPSSSVRRVSAATNARGSRVARRVASLRRRVAALKEATTSSKLEYSSDASDAARVVP